MSEHRFTLAELEAELQSDPDDADACRAFRALIEPALQRDPLGAAIALERYPRLQALLIGEATETWLNA